MALLTASTALAQDPTPPSYVAPLKLVRRFDHDRNGHLNLAERQAARAALESLLPDRSHASEADGPRSGSPAPVRNGASPQSGPRLSPADVPAHPDAPIYGTDTLRTFFLEFESTDWEQELADFHNTDVEVPARLVVDGRTYPEVGVHFRGQSSYHRVAAGSKRSLNLSLDFVHQDQKLGGYRTFNLLNSHGDPTFLRTVLYHHLARTYLPAPHANFLRVVINGECWGVYVNLQQFNRDFVRDWFGTTEGARWKVSGHPNGQGTLAYLGADVAAYRPIYEIKTKDDPKSWGPLIRLCEVLCQTPASQLEAALSPLLDIEGALRFLALENTLVNCDGYWTRASDYHLYLDPHGRFHLIPYDANESFSTGAGTNSFPSSRPDSSASRGAQVDPLVSTHDSTKPLLARLLAVPALRERYLACVRDIAETWLDWNRLGPLALHYQAVIADAVQTDTRKLDSTEALFRGVEGPPGRVDEADSLDPDQPVSLKRFAEQRRSFLLQHGEIQRIAGAPTPANRRPLPAMVHAR
ncbi:MAG: CotH kinase family protein [Verrucomicrobiales bacterium]|nr:CotH kinase family protein [Verrucomicrobiales bacterium]